MSKKFKIILLTVCLAFTLVFVFGLTGAMSEYDKAKQDFDKCVYLHSSETVFAEDKISVALKNVSDKDFEDVVLHLIYVDQDNKVVEPAYSAQKISTLKGEKTTILTFANPGWEHSSNNEIKVAVQDKENKANWSTLKTGSNFENIFEEIKTVTIFSSVGIFTFLVMDILITIWLVKDKSLVVAKAKEEETK